MRHRINDDVDSKWVGPLLRKLVEEVFKLLLALPAVTVIGIMAGHPANAVLFIQDRADVHLPALFAIMIFPCDPRVLALLPQSVVGNLQLVHRISEVERRMKNG